MVPGQEVDQRKLVKMHIYSMAVAVRALTQKRSKVTWSRKPLELCGCCGRCAAAS